MSDYFGALMRSSGLKVGPRHSGASPGDGQPANLSRTAPFPTHAGADDIVEIDETREARGTVLETSVRPSRSRESAAVDGPGFADRDAARARPSSEGPHEEVRVGGEAVDVERLQRAAIDAALRWVTSDPQAQRPELAGTGNPGRAAANESGPLPD